jgi:Fe2+ transport system protein FeoA
MGKKRVVPNAPARHLVCDMNLVKEFASRVDPRDCALCPLNRVKAGVEVRIKQLCASPAVTARLREMGLGEEQIIKLITSQANIICLVCNARMAISAHLAQAILVEPLSFQRAG